MARRHSSDQEQAEINITPMLDMTFILLIFFIVTTSFVRPTGASVQQPTAVTAKRLHSSILIGLTASGQIWMNKQKISVGQVQGKVEAARGQTPNGDVVIIADKDANTGLLVKIMNQAKLGGAQQIAIAAKQPQGGG